MAWSKISYLEFVYVFVVNVKLRLKKKIFAWICSPLHYPFQRENEEGWQRKNNPHGKPTSQLKICQLPRVVDFFFLINDKILCSQSGAVKAFTSSETLCATHLNERNKNLSLKKFPKTCSIGYTIIIFCYLKHWANSYNLGFWKENSIYFKQENRNKAFFPHFLLRLSQEMRIVVPINFVTHF